MRRAIQQNRMLNIPLHIQNPHLVGKGTEFLIGHFFENLGFCLILQRRIANIIAFRDIGVPTAYHPAIFSLELQIIYTGNRQTLDDQFPLCNPAFIHTGIHADIVFFSFGGGDLLRLPLNGCRTG